MRIIVSLCIVIGTMPVYRFIYAFTMGTDPSYCLEAIYTVNTGINTIYPISMIGIAIAVFHIYYRCVRKRVYESTYLETGYYDPTRERKLYKLLKGYLSESEPMLVVCWFNIVKTLIFVAAIWICLSPLLDAFYLYVNANSSGFYTNTDIEFTGSVYGFWHYIPIITVGFALFYAINYANWKRNE